MGLRLAANLGDAPREAVEHQPPLDEFFRVGIDVDRASPPLQVLDSFEQVLHVIDIAAAQLAECLVSLRVQLLGQKQAQRCPIAVLHVNADCPAFIWPLQFRGREPPLQLRKHVQDVLAGAECVCSKVRTRTIRVARLVPAHGDAVGLAGDRAGHGVICPRLLRIRRFECHPLQARPLQPLLHGPADEFLFAQAFHRHALGRRSGQAQRHLLVENKRERRTNVFAQ